MPLASRSLRIAALAGTAAVMVTGPGASVASASDPSTDTVAPTAPTGTRALFVTPTTARLEWGPSTDNSGRIGAYEVSTDGGHWVKAYRQLYDSTVTAHQFVGLPSGRTVRLGVRAVDAAGNVSPASFATVTTPSATDTVAPTPPGNLRMEQVAGVSTLRWDPALDAGGIHRYTLTLADPTLSLPAAMIISFGGTTTQISLTDLLYRCALAPGRYTVKIYAFDTIGNLSAASNPLTFTA